MLVVLAAEQLDGFAQLELAGQVRVARMPGPAVTGRGAEEGGGGACRKQRERGESGLIGVRRPPIAMHNAVNSALWMARMHPSGSARNRACGGERASGRERMRKRPQRGDDEVEPCRRVGLDERGNEAACVHDAPLRAKAPARASRVTAGGGGRRRGAAKGKQERMGEHRIQATRTPNYQAASRSRDTGTCSWGRSS